MYDITGCIGRHGTPSLTSLTERNDITKRHSIVITIEMEGMQEKKLSLGVRDRQKNPSLGITV